MPKGQPIVPKAHGLTPEAAEALGMTPEPTMEYDEAGTDSEVIEDYPPTQPEAAPTVVIPEPVFDFDVPPAAPTFTEDGDGIEVPVIEGRIAGRAQPPREEAKPEPERPPRTGPPDIDEWMRFFSRVVLRVAVEWYINWAFAGIDEDLLSEREIDRIQLSEDERIRIARPFAELSYKSKVMRKHGRMIVASGGAFDAIVTLGTWASRVNRIARKYKRPQPVKDARRRERTRPNEPAAQSANGSGQIFGTTGGSINDGLTIINPGS